MAKLLVSISVNNPDEVISAQKGKLVGMAAKLMSKEKRKEKVEREIYLALQQELAESLVKQLNERGIDSGIRVELID